MHAVSSSVLLAAVMLLLVPGVQCSVSEDHYPAVDAAANFAIDLHNHLNRYEYAFKVISILSELVQLCPPARVKFDMSVMVGKTVCKNQPGIDLHSCQFQEPSHMHNMTCRFVVLCVPNSRVPSHLLEDHCVTEAAQRSQSNMGSKL